jgi:sugar (pentulose or hexulose) kinase
VACLIGIDLGTSTTKSVLVSGRGELLASHAVQYSPDLASAGRAEQDPDTYFHAVLESIRACLARANIEPPRVAGIGISGLSPALILVDDTGVSLAPAQLWLDRRGARIAADLDQGPLHERILQTSGNPIDAYYGLVKLLWEKQHREEVYSRARWCFSAVNYVVYRLTGAPSLDVANASLFGIAFDLRRRDWDMDLLKQLDIRSDMFPPVLPCEAVAGKLTSEAAEVCGLLAGTPVVAGTVDGTAACLAAGATEPGDAIVTLGTSALLYVVHAEPTFSHRLIAICYPSRGTPMYTSVGAMSCGGVLFRFLRDLTADRVGDEEAYDRLTQLAE